MFVFSVKTTKKQMISIIVCVVMLIAILVVAIAWPSGQTAATGTQPYTPVEAASDEARWDTRRRPPRPRSRKC